MVDRMKNPRGEVDIGLVGKYVEYEDSYKSLKEALLHGGLAHQLKVNIHWIEAEGVLATGLGAAAGGLRRHPGAGGFGERGIEGMIEAIRYARESKVPYFGICLGMQTLVIEFARNVCGLAGRRFDRVRSRHAAPRHLQAARADGRRRAGRHHAAGRLALPAGRGQLRAARLRRARDQRAPPPPLRVQPRVRRTADGRGPAHHRRDARRHLRGDLRDRRTIPGSWAASSIPSSSRSRWSRIRCSRPSSAPPTSTGAARRTGRASGEQSASYTRAD